ncbi:peptidoglycan-binding domain-containing protein [Desulfovibrio inopinatus]|uniref:peptidoglycan-binding domain-containing protein n=1 Tax=Desulfovibrio inopinatus TaxID=102109 RepID=UPI000487F720|nr:peptidoglycan-binding domain-containing protein [Desulfovibrio inopinatus]
MTRRWAIGVMIFALLAVFSLPQTSDAQRYPKNIIRQTQATLNARGFYSGGVDGIWGPKTARAVRQFQAANGLPVTGTLEPGTIQALGLPAPPGPRPY